MEMMPMMVELYEFPEQFTPPFQDLSDSPLVEFSGGSSTSNYHTTLPPQSSLIFRYPPPVIMPLPLLRRGNWFKQKPDSVEAMREMIFRMAALQPVQIDSESVKPPKRRRNVKISKDPQSVAARHRRERISDRIRILQRLVPGGTKMVTASMLDEAAHYIKFLKKHVQSLEQAAGCTTTNLNVVGCSTSSTTTMHHRRARNHSHDSVRVCGQPATHIVGSIELLG